MASRTEPPLAFALFGASSHEPAHSAEAFALAVRLGATGLAARVATTRDGTQILSTASRVRSGLRRRAIRDLAVHELPDTTMTLSELARTSEGRSLSLEVADGESLDRSWQVLVEVEDELGIPVTERTWLSHTALEVVEAGARRLRDARLLHRTSLADMGVGQERHAASLASAGATGVILPPGDISVGLVTLYGRFGLATMSLDPVHDRIFDEVLATGLDGVYSAHVDRMMDAVERSIPRA